MRDSTRSVPAWLAAVTLAAATAGAQDARPAADIVRDFHRIGYPGFSGGNSPEAVAAFHRAVEDAAGRQCALALELSTSRPRHAAVAELLGLRWALLVNTFDRPAQVIEETDGRIGADTRSDLRLAALHGRAWAALHSDGMPAAQKLAHVERAFEADPDAERCGHYLVEFLQTEVVEPDAMRALCASIVDRWADDPWSARPAQALLRQLDRIGAPLPLDFDSKPGEDAAGRHVVAVFWSSPSDAAGDTLRTVQGWTTKFGGLAAIGVVNSRIDGGADALATHLATWDIDFPQAYDEARLGSPWDSPYATPRTPFFYLLDADRNVVRFAYTADVMERILEGALRGAGAADGGADRRARPLVPAAPPSTPSPG